MKKKETLEEAAERYAEGKSSSSVFQEAHKKDFIEGANWKQERMYSEEEAGELVYNVMGEYAKKENIFFKGDLINNLFNKFKKQIK